jgi:hypothetical protein
MQSKIIFVVLFMLTFTVVHDTVINIIHNDEHVSSAHYVHENVQSQECDSMDELHDMFHFVALVDTCKHSFIPLHTAQVPSFYTLLFTPPYKDPTYKPPIA